MGLPNINIEFLTKGNTAITRSERGIVALVLVDSTEGGNPIEVFNSVTDIDFTTFTERNYEYLKLVYEGAPSKVIVVRIPDEPSADDDESIEPEIEDPIEPEIEDPIEPEIEDPIEPEIEDPIEPEIEDPIEPEIEDPIEPEIEDPIEPEIEDPIEPEIEDPIEPEIEDPIEPEIEDPIEPDEEQKGDDFNE